MTTTSPSTKRRSATGDQRGGQVANAVVNAILLLATNVWPTWQVVPFLTEDTRHVLVLVNLVLAAGVVGNLAFAVADRPRLTALGNLVLLGIGVAALVRLWQVFPFDFGNAALDWAIVVRVLLIVGLAGSGIGMIVHLVTMVRGPRHGSAA